MFSPSLRRFISYCFSLLTGASATGMAEAMRTMHDNNARTKRSHLGYMVKIRWSNRRSGSEKEGGGT